MALTKNDIQNIQNGLRSVVREEVHAEIVPLRKDFSELQKSVDDYLTFVKTMHQNFVVLEAQVGKMRSVLVKKGVVNEQELSL